MFNSFRHFHKISKEFTIIAMSHWWDTLTCAQQHAYLQMHPRSDLIEDCKDGEDSLVVAPLSVDQANKIQVEEIKKYHDLRARELGYDPGSVLDLEWVKLHAKNFRERLKQHGLSR